MDANERPADSDAPAVSQEQLRRLPSVDALLRHATLAGLFDEFPRNEIAHCVREVLDERRELLREGEDVSLDTPLIALDIRAALYRRQRPSLRRVINATGIVLHTGLGRAPLSEDAVEAIAEVARGYSNLEIDLEDGSRGNRHDHVRELLAELTGAEDALVVNNNAGATYLALRALARDRSVVISRGQLVEIGGSYRMPDIMAAADCRMVEVGTTNRTHAADYERAIDPDTAMLIHVHTSNYRIEGFTTAPDVSELVDLRDRLAPGVFVVDDLGSGLLLDPEHEAHAALLEDWDEPSVRDSIAGGADLCLFSGDKLLGGPQAGIIVGRADLIERLRRDPLARALRPDKLSLAGLEATLRLYRAPDQLLRRLPIYRLLTRDEDDLTAAAEHLAEQIAQHLPNFEAEVIEEDSYAGGGSLPTLVFPSRSVHVVHETIESGDLAARLRDRDVPIVCRQHSGALVFDCRTLDRDDLEAIPAALTEVESDARTE